MDADARAERLIPIENGFFGIRLLSGAQFACVCSNGSGPEIREAIAAEIRGEP